MDGGPGRIERPNEQGELRVIAVIDESRIVPVPNDNDDDTLAGGRTRHSLNNSKLSIAYCYRAQTPHPSPASLPAPALEIGARAYRSNQMGAPGEALFIYYLPTLPKSPMRS